MIDNMLKQFDFLEVIEGKLATESQKENPQVLEALQQCQW